MLSRWWIFKEAMRAGIQAFRSTRGILSSLPAPHSNSVKAEKVLLGLRSTVRGQLAAALGENDRLLGIMDDTFKYLSSNMPKIPSPSVSEGRNVLPFPGTRIQGGKENGPS